MSNANPLVENLIENRIAAWAVLILLSAIALFSQITQRYGWSLYLEIFSHFQLQYLMLTVILLAALLVLRCRRPILIGLFLVALLSASLAAWYLPSASAAATTRADLRILSANINTQNQQYDKVLDLVRSQTPDIAVFIEVDETWRQQFDALSSILPYAYGQSDPFHSGLLVYSKAPLENVSIELFGTEDHPSVVAQITDDEEGPITLIATHPFPPIRASLFHSRNQQLDRIADYLNQRPETNPATRKIVVGDLNITMWSPYYKRFINKTGLRNTSKGFGILPTWPISHPILPNWLVPLFRIPIDHCLVGEGLRSVSTSVGSDIGSDHSPLIVDLEFTS